MLTKEERVVFETELTKLYREYRKCGNRSLKLQIKQDISLLKSVISPIYEQKI